MPNQCGSSWACFDMTKACSGKGVLILAILGAIVFHPNLLHVWRAFWTEGPGRATGAGMDLSLLWGGA